MNMAQRGMIAAVRLYQMTLSPVLAALLGPASHCRFQPTCSRYAVEAIQLHGAIYGACLAAKRLARCHPWGKFGADPVPLRPVTPDLETETSRLGCCHHGS